MDKLPFKSLLNPGVYPEPTESVRLVQTHISYLFITDDFVYKIKKPVDLGFLNFSTIDRRRFYCAEEVRLNRRLCPDIYLGVVEVRLSPDGPAFCGDGPAMDYAVKMKRLPESLMLDRMLAEGAVTAAGIREIARVIAGFHLRAERGAEIDENGSIGSIKRSCEENFHQIEELLPLALAAGDLTMIRKWVYAFISDNEPLFAGRVREGFIRDCDGDIHLENICMTSPICIFDCIEFNSRFRHIDTAADIAFFLMDLDFHGKDIFAEPFLDEYILRTGDTGLTPLLDFYKINRAVVRSKVELLKLLDPQIPEPEKDAAREKARRYFRLARGYLLRRGGGEVLIITCGLTGSGKSHVASALASHLAMELLSSDVVRRELAHLPPGRRYADEFNKGLYAPSNSEATYSELLRRSENILRGGRGVIVDATFRRKRDRLLFANLAARLKVPIYILHTRCPEDLVKRRLEERSRDPAAVSDGRWEVYVLQKEEFEPPETAEGNLITLDTSKALDDIIDCIAQTMEHGDETQTKG